MPIASIPPHYPQSKPGACLPACARMVLAALGREFTEAELARTLDSYSFGTQASNVIRLQRLGHEVQHGSMTVDELRVHLEAGRFPIVFVLADFLPWADFEGLHALVVVGIDEKEVFLHDPALAEGSERLSMDGFLIAWEEFDRRGAIVFAR